MTNTIDTAIDTAIGRVKDPAERLVAFILERDKIKWQKDHGLPMDNRDGRRLWTDDPILQEYRFCNVRREDDRVTRWIAACWREPHADDPDLWFAMVVARFINWPDTLACIGYPAPWDPVYFLNRMRQLKDDGVKLYTGAYMVRAGSTPGEGKAAYQEREVFTPMWEARERLRPKEGDTLNSYHVLLGQFHGLGSFMAAQVVADLKYTATMEDADDWWTFAASGPGSRRGLNRALGRGPKAPWSEDNWRLELGRLEAEVRPGLVRARIERLHAQDLQNCLCEFDKYERVRLGEGRPRARYVSHG